MNNDFSLPQPYADLKQTLVAFHDGNLNVKHIYQRFFNARLNSDTFTKLYRQLLDQHISHNDVNPFYDDNYETSLLISEFIDEAYRLLLTGLFGVQATGAEYGNHVDIKHVTKTLHQMTYVALKQLNAELYFANDNADEISNVFYQVDTAVNAPVYGLVKPQYYEAASSMEGDKIKDAWFDFIIDNYCAFNIFDDDNHAELAHRLIDNQRYEDLKALNAYYTKHQRSNVTMLITDKVNGKPKTKLKELNKRTLINMVDKLINIAESSKKVDN